LALLPRVAGRGALGAAGQVCWVPRARVCWVPRARVCWVPQVAAGGKGGHQASRGP
jgi:hypothetical protein